MQFTSYLPGIGIGIGLVAVLLALKHLAGSQQRRFREEQREHLAAFAVERGYRLMEGRGPATVKDCTAIYRGREQKNSLRDVCSGSDEFGTFYFAHRAVAGTEHQALVFENKLLTLERYRVEPLKEATPGGLRRLWHRLRGRVPQPMHLRLVWDVDPQRVDDRSGLMAQELLLQMATLRKHAESLGLHLEVDQQRVVIHNRKTLSVEPLRIFIDAALELRRRVLEAPHVSGALRLSPGDTRSVRTINDTPRDQTTTRAVPILSRDSGPRRTATGPSRTPITRVNVAERTRHIGPPSGPELPYGAMSTADRLRHESGLQKAAPPAPKNGSKVKGS